MSLTIYRKAHFNAAHRLFRKDWSDAKNKEVLESAATPIIMGIITNWKWESLEKLTPKPVS